MRCRSLLHECRNFDVSRIDEEVVRRLSVGDIQRSRQEWGQNCVAKGMENHQIDEEHCNVDEKRYDGLWNVKKGDGSEDLGRERKRDGKKRKKQQQEEIGKCKDMSGKGRGQTTKC